MSSREVKLAVVIIAHKSPEQVALLCDRLRSPNVDCYLHVDSKCDIKPYQKLIPNAIFIKNRHNVAWGQLSIVESIIGSLQEVATNGNYDYVTLLSGQDYPIVPIDQILSELSANKGTEYISQRALQPGKDDRFIRKATYPHYVLKSKSATIILYKLLYKLPFLKRRYPTPDGQIYFGSCWWTLTGGCVDYILKYCNENPGFMKFHRRAFCSDEFFIQNIVMYSRFAERVVPYKHYIDWSEQKPNPKTLRIEDFELIASSGMWYARKFDIAVDSQILSACSRIAISYHSAYR